MQDQIFLASKFPCIGYMIHYGFDIDSCRVWSTQTHISHQVKSN